MRAETVLLMIAAPVLCKPFSPASWQLFASVEPVYLLAALFALLLSMPKTANVVDGPSVFS